MPLPTSSVSGSINNATSANRATSQAQTFGTQATSAARAAAEQANQIAMQQWQASANFNAEEAAKQRAWMERMANTVYQRTVEDMQKAGINPILAANMGLGTASVSGGGAASIGTPNSYMANTYPDSISSSESIGNSESHGNSWGESGFTTFLSSIAALAEGLMNAQTSSTTINLAIEGLKEAASNPTTYAKDYEGADEKGKPKAGYTEQYDSEKGKYLTEEEVKSESFFQGLLRGIQNKTNAYLGIRKGDKSNQKK